MDLKAKLVELLDNFHRDLSPFAGNEKLFMVDDNIEQAEYLIAHGVTVQEWISVKDRLPGKMGQYVCRYVFGENTDYPFYQVLWYFANLEKPHFQHAGSMGLTVTHWMHMHHAAERRMIMPKNGVCKKCNNLVNGWCEKVIDSPDPDMVRDCRHFWERTNADRIKSMGNDDMARTLYACPWCHHHCEHTGEAECLDCIVRYLQQPAEDTP